MADKPRPSVQLLIDRTLVARFKGLCVTNGTTASAVVARWMEEAVKAGKVPLPTDPKKK